MTAGVTVDFNANLARFTTSVEKATADLGKFQSKAESVSAKIGSTFATLGVGLSVAGFAAMIKGSIDAQDRMNDLRLTTNLTIETLTGLEFAAKVSGGDLESIASSVNKLAVNMGKDAEKFAKLGITAKDPLEAYKQLADVFSQVQDPQLRAALGAESLGKKWEGAAPLLMEGSKGIADLVEKGERLSGMTAKSTKDADEFNDKWEELFGTGKLLNTVVGEALPLLNALAEDMITARNETGDLNSEFKPLLETGKAVTILFGNVAFVMKAVGTEIGGIAAQFAALGKGEFAKAWAIGDIMKQDAEEARKAFDAWEARILGIGGRAEAAGKDAKKKRNAELEETVRGVVDPDKKTKAAKRVGSVEDYAMRIQQAVAGAISDSAVVKSRELADQIAALDKLFFESGLDADIYTSALEKLVHMTASVSDQEEKLARLLEATPTEQLEKARQDMQLLADAFEKGRINEEQFNEAAIARLGKTGQALDENAKFARDMGLSFASAFEDAVIGGGKLSDVLRGLEKDIARIVLRKTVTEPLGNGITDLIKGSSLGSSLGGSGGLFGSIKSLFGFANGGAFTVGGAGGTDSQLVAFKATPGEEVLVRTPGQQGGGGITIQQHIYPSPGVSSGDLMQAMVAAKNAAVAEIHNSMRRGGAFA